MKKKKFLISIILVAILILALVPLASIKATYYDAYLDSTDTYYETAQEAINAAATYGGTVTLRDNISSNITIPYATVNINLNGFNLTGHITINGNLNVRGNGSIVPAGKTNQPANTYDLSNCTINGTIRVNKNLTYTYADLNATAYLVLPYNGEVNFTSNNSSVVSSGRIVKNSENGEYLNTVIYNINRVGNTNTNIMTTDEKVNIALNVTVNPVELTVKTVNVANKVYDGNTNATINSLELQGFARDEEYVSGTDYTFVGNFNNANVGNNKTVNIVFTLNNETLSRNYYVNNYQTTANITSRVLTEANVTLGTTEYTYSGSAKTPSVTVKVGNTTLVNNTDYTFQYVNNINAGSSESVPTVVVTGIGNYAGTVNKVFTINKVKLAKPTVSGTYSYNKLAQTVVLSNFDSNTMSVTGNTKTNAGNYTAVVSIKDTVNYEWADGTNSNLNLPWTISAKDLNSNEVSLSRTEYTYDGSTKTPGVIVKDGETTLTLNSDYTVLYSSNTNAGTATVTVTGIGNYKNVINKTFTINKAQLTKPTISGTYTFNGTTQTVSLNNFNSSTMNVSNNTRKNAGTQNVTVSIKDTANYEWTDGTIANVSLSWTINAKNLNSDEVTLSNTVYTYNGSAKTPDVTVTDGTTTLVKDTDYTVSYSSNVNAGTATVTVTGIGNYKNTVNKTFTINKAQLTIPTINGTYTYNGTTQTVSLNNFDSSTMNVSNNTRKNAGTQNVTVSLKDTANYEWANATITNKDISWTIAKKNISDLTVVLSQNSYVYNGTDQRESVTAVKFGNETLVLNTDYTVSYPSSDYTNAGEKTIRITAKDNTNYTGTKDVTFVINKARLASFLDDNTKIKAEYSDTLITKLPIKLPFKNNDLVSAISNNEGIITVSEHRSDIVQIGGLFAYELEFNITGAGQTTAIVNVAETQNYLAASKEVEVVITQAPIHFTATANNKVYDRSTVTTSSGVTFLDLVRDEELQEGVDYRTEANFDTIAYGTDKDVDVKVILLNTVKANNYVVSNANDIYKTKANITKLAISNENTTVEVPEYTYNGGAIVPECVVKVGDVVLVEGEDYTVSCTNNTNAGTAEVTITGIGSCYGTANGTFTIKKKQLAKPTLNGTYTFNREIQEVDLDGFDSDTMSVTENRKTNAGEYTAIVSLKDSDNYEWVDGSIDNIEINWIINKKQLAKPTLKGTYTFNREIQEVDLDGFDSDTMSVTENRKTNAGKYTAIVSLKDSANYEWTDKTITDVTIGWEIKAKDIDSSTITIIPDLYTFDGENKKPTVTVKDADFVLEENTEYTVVIENNKNAGKAKVTVSGKGNYKGTKIAEFTIEQAELKIENTNITLEETVYDYDGNAKEPKVTVKHGTTTLEKNVDYTVSYSNNVKSGVATAVITGKGNYKGTQSKTFIINPKAVVLSTVKNVKTNKVEIKWEKDSYVDGYEVYMTTVKKDNQNMKTKSQLTLRKSTSTKSKALKTLPKGAKLQILKKNVKITEGYTWYKVKYNGKTGYVASKFLKDIYVEGTYSRIKKVTSNDTLSYTKKKLTKNKQYVFKVRSYKVIDGVTYYGTYSNVKKVTIKK